MSFWWKNIYITDHRHLTLSTVYMFIHKIFVWQIEWYWFGIEQSEKKASFACHFLSFRPCLLSAYYVLEFLSNDISSFPSQQGRAYPLESHSMNRVKSSWGFPLLLRCDHSHYPYVGELCWDNFIADSGVLFPWQQLGPDPWATEEVRWVPACSRWSGRGNC